MRLTPGGPRQTASGAHPPPAAPSTRCLVLFAQRSRCVARSSVLIRDRPVLIQPRVALEDATPVVFPTRPNSIEERSRSWRGRRPSPKRRRISSESVPTGRTDGGAQETLAGSRQSPLAHLGETLAVMLPNARRIETPNFLVRAPWALVGETIVLHHGAGSSSTRRRFASRRRILSSVGGQRSKTRRMLSSASRRLRSPRRWLLQVRRERRPNRRTHRPSERPPKIQNHDVITTNGDSSCVTTASRLAPSANYTDLSARQCERRHQSC